MFLLYRFGTFLGLAHAAMTAEGDNSVLMQKVAKERLGLLAKQPLNVVKPSTSSLEDTDYLLYLVRARELNLFKELGRRSCSSVSDQIRSFMGGGGGPDPILYLKVT